MEWRDVWNVLRWVLAALAAGFVGQFGKSLALAMLRQRRSRREDTARQDQVAAPARPLEADAAALADLAKIEKKRAKAEVKRLKKS